MQLVYQVQNSDIRPDNISIVNLNIIPNDMTVPFLSPANMKWPDYLKEIPQSKFGNLERARNSDRVDLMTDCGIFGEAKDYGEKITLDTMRKIIRRIPGSGTKLHLVFTRELQNSYFVSSSFRREFSALKHQHVLNMAFFKIDASKATTSLEPIVGLPSQVSSAGIVLFFLIDKSIALTPQQTSQSLSTSKPARKMQRTF